MRIPRPELVRPVRGRAPALAFGAALIFGVCAGAARPGEARTIYGIHDHDPDPSEYLAHIEPAGGGWVTATVAVGHNPSDPGGVDFTRWSDAGHTVICRINNGYYPNGTIPLPADYDAFAARCANFAQNSPGCAHWVIGNEPNISGEWPSDGSRHRFVSPEEYAACYAKAYAAIKAVRPDDCVMPAALAPWAGPYGAGSLNGVPHDGNPINWVTYLRRMLTAAAAAGAGPDGIALHINSRGYGIDDIHSGRRVNAAGQSLSFSFYVYRDWIELGIPQSMWGLPLYATECNGYYFWRGGHAEAPGETYQPGWMQEIYAEIDRHNRDAVLTGRPVFRCVNMYRWCGACDGWNIDSSPFKGQILSDLDDAVAQNYRWPAAGPRTEVIAADAEWRYRDDGGPPPAGWNTLGFDDSGWPRGRAKLGFGDSDETTTLGSTTAGGAPVLTAYFRRAFSVADADSAAVLAIRLLRDDGAVVYLNGQEIARSNMPGGLVNYQTLAAGTVGGADEAAFFTMTADPAALRDGENVLAAEVHQAAAASSDLGFALDLAIIENIPPSVSLELPAAGVVEAGAAVTFSAAVDDMDGSAPPSVEFFANGASLGASGGPPFDVLASGFPPGRYAVTAVVTDEHGAAAESPPRVIEAAPTFIRAGSAWKFLDTGAALPTSWRGLAFDDSGWAAGPAKLGYGDSDVVTTVSFGNDANAKHITTYFRREIFVPPGAAVGLAGLEFRIRRDDGAVVYLNGAEVGRTAMPAGAITSSTLASATAGGDDEETFFPLPAAAGLLLAGRNVVAVEIHQASVSSSDLGFDLRLVGRLAPAPPPLSARFAAGEGILSWPAIDPSYGLQRSLLLVPGSWLQVAEPPASARGILEVRTPIGTQGTAFFRLAAP